MTNTRNKFCYDVLGHSKEKVIEIQDRLPCRNNQLHVLLKLLGPRTSIASPCLFLYGHTATGKSLVVETLLKELKVSVCLDCLSVCKIIICLLRAVPRTFYLRGQTPFCFYPYTEGYL